MNTKLTDILDCLNTLRDYLTEAHQEELDSAHHGDESGCSYCLAIAKADGILALNSDPEEINAAEAALIKAEDELHQAMEEENEPRACGLLPESHCSHGNGRNSDGECVVCGKPQLENLTHTDVSRMRAGLLKMLELATATPPSIAVGAEDAHIEAETKALDFCREKGWDWEQAKLPSGEYLWQYCLKATPQECAEATLIAFDAFVGTLPFIEMKTITRVSEGMVNMFKTWRTLTPAEAVSDPDCHHIDATDVADYERTTKHVLICNATHWYMDVTHDGDICTTVGNESELHSDMDLAVAWIRDRYFI